VEQLQKFDFSQLSCILANAAGKLMAWQFTSV